MFATEARTKMVLVAFPKPTSFEVEAQLVKLEQQLIHQILVRQTHGVQKSWCWLVFFFNKNGVVSMLLFLKRAKNAIKMIFAEYYTMFVIEKPVILLVTVGDSLWFWTRVFDAPAVEFNSKLGGSWRSPMGPKPKPRPCKLDRNMEDSTAQHWDTEINLRCLLEEILVFLMCFW